MRKELKSLPKTIMKIYKDEIEHLIRDEEKVREIYAVLRSNLPSIVRGYSKKVLNLSNLKEDQETLISELVFRYLKFSTLDDITNVLFPKTEKVPEEVVIYIAKPIRDLLANYLHQEIPRFPSAHGLEMIFDFYKLIEKISERNERKRLKRGFNRIFRKHYTYTKDTEAEVEAWREVGRRRAKSYVLRPLKAGEVSIGPAEIMKVVGWMKKVRDSLEFHDKAKNIDIRVAEIIVNSKPIMSEYKLLLDLFETYINPEELNEKTILDLGCGCKSPLIDVIEKKGIKAEVIGLDDCQKFLKLSKETFPEQNYLQANFPYTLPFVDNAFDYIFAVCSMHFNNRIEKYATLAGLHQLLKKGGKFFIVHPRSQKVSHLETKQYLESLSYNVHEKRLKVDWVGLKPSYFYLLIAEKTLQTDKTNSYVKGVGMSYLKAAKNRSDAEEKNHVFASCV
ncbi:MAG: class I SAM-dependent methyltransferase [Candidatus Aenigmatarchaeota archaeon]